MMDIIFNYLPANISAIPAIWLWAFITFLGGVAYCLRGGMQDWSIGTQGARLLWAAFVGFIAFGLSGAVIPFWAPIATGVASFITMLLFSHGGNQRCGQGDQPGYESYEWQTKWCMIFPPFFRDLIGLSFTYTLRLIFMAAPLAYFNPVLWLWLTAGVGSALLSYLFMWVPPLKALTSIKGNPGEWATGFVMIGVLTGILLWL